MEIDKNRVYACSTVENNELMNNKPHIKAVLEDKLRNMMAKSLIKYKAKMTEHKFDTEFRIELICFTPEEFREYREYMETSIRRYY